MPKIAPELSAIKVRRLRPSGDGKKSFVLVGGVSGLALQITPSGGRSWILRTAVGLKRREIGLGSYPAVSLADARRLASEVKEKIRRGVDPVEERKAARAMLIAAQSRSLTFSEAIDRALDAKLDAFSNPKHRAQWRSTLDNYAAPVIGEMPVNEIQVHDVLRVLEPIWREKTETASRLRGRIEAVLSWATVSGYRLGDNPARWKGNLKELLPAPKKLTKSDNQPALRIDDAPRWFAELQSRDGMGSQALIFLALTAARSGEVRGATWDEIDLEAAIWTVPAERMKASREHRIPLASGAVALLNALPRFSDNRLVFPAPRGGALSDMTLSAAMKRIHESDKAAGGPGFTDRVSGRPAVPHGLRSTFRDWVAERTDYSGDMAEMALAHRVSNAVEAAYRRGEMVEKRRRMMAAWARYLNGGGT